MLFRSFFFIGPPLINTFMEHYGFTKERALEAVEKYRERYNKIGIFECSLFPGVKECIEALKAAGYRMDLYLKFSSMLREIYGEYTDLVEPYGCDEAWLDVTDSAILKGDGRKIAEEISWRVKKELGITVSIGISWNKIFAKLGSDYKKPDGITAFSKGNYKELLWRLPAADLLYVGRSTRKTLDRYGIKTIEIGRASCRKECRSRWSPYH